MENRDHDNADISNTVLHVMDVASKLYNIELNEECIEADVVPVNHIDNDEDMLIAMCYIAECYTFGLQPELELIDLEFQR